MAKKPTMKLNHGEDVIDWNIQEDDKAAEKHIARVEQNREKQFENHNMKLYKEMLDTYNDYSEQFINGTQDEQIMLLNRFYQVREFSAWIIGDFLLTLETKIMRKTYFIDIDRHYNSLREYFEINKELLGFDYSTGTRYLAIRKGLTIDEFKRTGIRKGLAIASAPEELRPKLLKKITNNEKITEKQLQMEIAEFKGNINQEKKIEKQAEEKKAAKAVKYNMITDKGGTKITIQPLSFDVELMQEALNHFEMQIKAYIKKRLEE
jgi:hypothetical protein